MDAELEIPCARVAEFVRQHTHDLRNGLNSLDLETALLQELVTGAEEQACVRRVRQQVRNVAEQLRALAAQFQDPRPVAAPIAARELWSIWREQTAALPEAPEVQWVDQLGDEKVNVDAGLMTAVFRELLANAAAFSQGGPLTMTAWRDAKEVSFELREPKPQAVDPSGWGQPFATTRPGHRGLGLWGARRLVAASGATLVQRYVPEEGRLVTRISAPVVQSI